MEDLSIAYDLNSLDEVLGQDAVINSIKELQKTKLPNLLVFTGPSGFGKTTLARICAASVDCVRGYPNLIETNCGESSGVDAMRTILDGLHFTLIGYKNRAFILDEAHALSAQAWNSLLKPMEEPPPGVYWIICTTNPTKLPDAVKTRAHQYVLKKLPVTTLLKLLLKVIAAESITLDSSIVNAVAIKANGCPRLALVYLSMVRGCTTVAQANEIINAVGDAEGSPNGLEFCRQLSRHASWNEVIDSIKKIEEDPESIRYMVRNYFAKVVMNAKSEEERNYCLGILNAFKDPFNPGEKLAPLVLAVATCLL